MWNKADVIEWKILDLVRHHFHDVATHLHGQAHLWCHMYTMFVCKERLVVRRIHTLVIHRHASVIWTMLGLYTILLATKLFQCFCDSILWKLVVWTLDRVHVCEVHRSLCIFVSLIWAASTKRLPMETVPAATFYCLLVPNVSSVSVWET